MADERLTVTYEGPALGSGRMDVRDLAPALIGIADAVGAANSLVHPGSPKPGVAISATNEGSFEVILHVVDHGVLDRAMDLLTGRETTTAVNLTALVGVVVGGVKLVLRLGKHRIRSISPPQAGEVVVSFDDGSSVRLPEKSIDAAKDLGFRQAAKRTVDPLNEDRVDSVTISGGSAEVQVGAPDKRAFDVPEAEEEELEPVISQRNLRLLNVAFTEGHKWRVSEGDEPLYVRIADEDFLRRVETNQEAFTAGDVLRVELETRQWNTSKGIRAEHIVTHVIEHIQGPRQLPLPLAEDPDDA